jgi:hexosaminidase
MKKNYIYFALIMFSAATILISCQQKAPSDLTAEALIPKPVTVTATGDYFKLRPGTDIFIKNGSDEVKRTGKFLADLLKKPTGYNIDIRETDSRPQSGTIILNIDAARSALGEEGYELSIEKRIITLTAAKPAGLFRGVQTIRQLLPVKIETEVKQEGPWEIPTGTITDRPEYSYRGAMVDVARHFFGVEEIKNVIDHLAYYKMNILHLHLSDDQGWRIEIKSWPNLTTHGGSTQVGGGKGGYYSQEQYADIVKYAMDRYITIVPEIDMPGHTNAALASYPELNCNGKATELYTGTKVGFSSLCVDKDITYKFIDDVIREISMLTPGPWFHIGGDESHATKEKDYIFFINKAQEIVAKYEKLVAGWDEIALSTLKPNTVAQFWANAENAGKAVSQGAKLIMSPAKKAYLDMKYTRETKLGLRWAGLIEVDTAYIWDPEKYVPGIGKENILGIEAPLWTETISTMEEMEYMLFPRLPGYSEIGWTPASLRNWEEYKVRLGKHGIRLKERGVNFYASPLVPWAE